MSLIYSLAATASVSANTNNISIVGLDLSTVLPGMTISIGARGRLTGDAYIIATVTPSGTAGGTLTVVDPVASAYTSTGFVIDTRDFNGTAPNYLIATYTQVLNALLRLTSPLTNLFTGSRQLALDKDSAGAVSRLLYAIGGRSWGALEQRTATYTPTGGTLTTAETVTLRAYPDGTTPVDALTVDLSTGTGDLRKASAMMAAAATVDLGSAPVGKIALTGAATVFSLGAGRHLERLVHVVTGGATLVHNAASLVLPGGANIVVAAGDCFHATSDASGNWRVRDYVRASGKPVIGPAAAEILDASASGLAVLTGSPAAGATALGLGSAAMPVFAGVMVGSLPLGTASGARTPAVTLVSANVGNTDQLGIFHYRKQAGSDHTSTEQIIQRRVDAVDMGFLSFGSNNAWLGSGTTKILGVGSNEAVVNAPLTATGPIRPGSFTLATVPAGTAGMLIFVSNGRKSTEGAGGGTGVVACYSNGNWRRLSDDSPVAA